MGTIIIQEETTKNPITLIGKEAGICYGSDTSNDEKNYKRGKQNIASGHGRTMEYPQIYMVIDGYSARVIRELYTHIGGAPTRLQASTRYIKYGEFDFITPPSIAKDERLVESYNHLMKNIQIEYGYLEACGISKEDIANILPLGMTTKIVFRTNLRNLIDMAHQRLCTRAYWEYRQLMRDIMNALSEYSDEWKEIVDTQFKAKCDVCGYCSEHNSCGRHISEKDFKEIMKNSLDDLK